MLNRSWSVLLLRCIVGYLFRFHVPCLHTVIFTYYWLHYCVAQILHSSTACSHYVGGQRSDLDTHDVIEACWRKAATETDHESRSVSKILHSSPRAVPTVRRRRRRRRGDLISRRLPPQDRLSVRVRGPRVTPTRTAFVFPAGLAGSAKDPERARPLFYLSGHHFAFFHLWKAERRRRRKAT